LLDPGTGRLVEDSEQAAGPLPRPESGPPQRRDAGDGLRPGHDVQEPTGDAQADALGLGDGGEFVLLLGGDLDGTIQPLPEGLDLGLLLGEVALKVIDPGSGRGTVHGLGDLVGLAVERLPRLIAVVGQLGDIAVSSAENREGTGDSLRDRGHWSLAPSRPIDGSRP